MADVEKGRDKVDDDKPMALTRQIVANLIGCGGGG